MTLSDHSDKKIPGSIVFPVVDDAKIPCFAVFGERHNFEVNEVLQQGHVTAIRGESVMIWISRFLKKSENHAFWEWRIS